VSLDEWPVLADITFTRLEVRQLSRHSCYACSQTADIFAQRDSNETKSTS